MAKKKTAMQMEMNTPFLPSELLIEILLRLPVKSLISFKCLSKSWFSLISHPNFANSHFQITSASRILIIKSHQYPSIKFQSIDVEFNRDSTILNHDFLLPQHPYSPCQIKGSCRGFIYLHSNVDILIWNPSSGIRKQIPLSPFDLKLRSSPRLHLYGFGYDHSRDDYLLVIVTYDHIANRSSHLEFFSLRDNMWNEIRGTPFTYLCSITRSHACGSFINGAIHWLATKSVDSQTEIIVAFDLIERKLFEMPLPDDFYHRRGHYSLLVFGEFLSLWVVDYDNGSIEIWVMKEYKQHSSWTKTIVILGDLWNTPFIEFLCHTKSGDIIGNDDNCDRLVKYNGKGQLLEYLQIDEHAKELVIYTESLFSLPSDREQV